MCGRYVSATPPAELAEQFGVTDVRAEDLGPRYNVAPTSEVYAVAVGRDGERRLGTFRWGLVPSWAKDPAVGNRMLNAKAETVAEKPAFRRAFERRRCILPADGFYEWLREGRSRRPFYVTRTDGRPMALAGLWEVWHDPADPDGTVLRTCTILTTEANPALRPVHDRMPVVLEPDEWEAWLDPARRDREGLLRLLDPAPDGALSLREVSTRVNDVRHDGPDLLEAPNG